MESHERREHEWRALRDGVLRGDEAAWRTLYDGSYEPLYRHVYARTGRHMGVTEELVQETWLVAVRKIRGFDPGRGTFDAWLRGIADHLLRNWRRRRARRGPAAELPALEDAAAKVATGRIELAEELALVLGMLPGHYQRVLLAKYNEQLSVAEIADRCQTSTKAVESLLSRARAAFREALETLRGDAN